MAEIYEIIDRLLQEKGISGAKMARDLGMSRSFMTELRKGRAKSINAETAGKIADYFDVPVAYLLGREEKSPSPSLTPRDRRDIARDLEAFIADMDRGDLMFDGDPMSDEARESIISAVKLGLEAAKAKNKERFTPKKYKKE